MILKVGTFKEPRSASPGDRDIFILGGVFDGS